MSVTLAQMAVRLAASTAEPMRDVSIDAETTRLAREAQAGSTEAFCALVDLHQRAARRVAAAALGSGADADEAVQDACLAAWQRIDRLDDPTAFRAWLLRITWRKALDRRRSITAWLRRTWHADTQRDGDRPDDPLALLASPQTAPDDELLSLERDRIVAQTIRSLPPRLRDPFLLAASGEHRYEEIAGLLRIPVGTVKWRVSEARRVLRDKLTRRGVTS